jgi:membrane-associated phospholipid phosphatase
VTATMAPARWRLALGDLAAIDDAVYRAVAATPSPALDRPLARLSRAADHSVLWIGIAAGLAAGGGSGRRAAVAGLGSVAVASAVVNAGLKHLHGRPRPDGARVGRGRAVRMPRSASFPSGHAASAFAFATAAGAELPVAALPLRCLAAAVAYARVHGGAHYPGDVIGGALLGGAVAAALTRGVRTVAAG